MFAGPGAVMLEAVPQPQPTEVLVRVQIAGVYPLAQVAEAHRQGEAGHTQGKLVLTVSP
jgi:NADPH:quinone reductase-like Zn-dependent oxidoreductase